MSKSDFGQDGSPEELFTFMDEREKIYQRKLYDEPRPWTLDPILDKYFFCNVYRENDKVTKWIRENWRGTSQISSLIVFNMIVARFFNWIPTLKEIGFTDNWEKQRENGIAQELNKRAAHYNIFNSAYLIAGTDLKRKTKVDGVCDRLDWAWENRKNMTQGIIDFGALEHAWWVLQNIPGVAGFLSYEIVTDLRHTPILENAPDIMTWANPGPGAKRGLQRIFSAHMVHGVSHQIDLIYSLLIIAPKYTELKLEMRDIEHSLCEYDKYQRIKQAIREERPVLGMRKYHGKS